MGGVDLSYQLMKNYSCARRTVKWWRKLFTHLLCATLCNSYILYKKSCDKPISHFDFQLSVVKALVLAAPGNPGPSTSGRKLSEIPAGLPTIRIFP